MVADDFPLVLDILAQTLGAIEGFDVISCVTTSAQIMPVLQRDRPGVALLSASMTNFDCVPTLTQVRRTVPSCGVAIIASRPSRAMVNQAISAGALSVVARNSRLPQLVGAIRGVAAGCLTLDPALVPESNSSMQLTERERDVLSLTATGASAKEIAAQIFLSVGTVRNISSASIQKLKARNRFDAARIAQEKGWL